MLAALLLAAIVAAPLGSVALFLPLRQRLVRTAGLWPAVRFVLAVGGTAALAAVAAGVLRLLGIAGHNLIAGAAGVVFASAVWLPATRRWSRRSPATWGRRAQSAGSSRGCSRAGLPTLRDLRGRDRRAFAAGAATGGAVVVAGVVIGAIALMLAPGRHPVRPPDLAGPAQGSASAPASPAPARSSAPGSSPATPPGSPASPAPSSTPPSPPPSPSPSISRSVSPSVSGTAPASPPVTPTG